MGACIRNSVARLPGGDANFVWRGLLGERRFRHATWKLHHHRHREFHFGLGESVARHKANIGRAVSSIGTKVLAPQRQIVSRFIESLEARAALGEEPFG